METRYRHGRRPLRARMHLANYAKLPRDLVELRGVVPAPRKALSHSRKKRNFFCTDDYDSLLREKTSTWWTSARHRPCIMNLPIFSRRQCRQAHRHGERSPAISASPAILNQSANTSRARPHCTTCARSNAAQSASGEPQWCKILLREELDLRAAIEKMRRLIALPRARSSNSRQENHSAPLVFSPIGNRPAAARCCVWVCIHVRRLPPPETWEGSVALKKGIRPVSVLADVANLITARLPPAPAKPSANQWISANPVDVENWANLVIAFEDGARATRDRQRRRSRG